MSGWLGNLQLGLVAWLGLALAATALGSALLPSLLARPGPAHPATRGLLLFAVAVAPVALPALGVFLLFVPSLLVLLGVAADHCHLHGDHHLHLCLIHPWPPRWEGPLPLLAALGLGFVGLQGLHLARAAILSSRVSGTLGGRRGGAPGSFSLLDSPRPLAFCQGWLRPRIYLSRGLHAALSPEQVAVVLAHEHSHARRRDALRLAVAASASLLYGPRLRARLLEELSLAAELLCDEAAAVGCGDRLRVAETLLRMERLAGAGSSPVAPAFAGRRTAARIARMLGPAATPRGGRSGAVLSGVLLLSVLMTGVEPFHHGIESLLHQLAG